MRPACPLFALALLAALPMAARAQIVLPGAVAPTPEGADAGPSAPAQPAAPKPKPHRKASEEALPATPAPSKVTPATVLAGQTLLRNGRDGAISFTLRDRALVVSHLSLKGQTENGAECRIDVADLPLATTDQGHPQGIARISIAFPACPLTFDVMSDAALASIGPNACTFAATHCTVDPSGLWGPQTTGFGADRDKAIERQRAGAEAAMRENYKRLLKTTKDRPTIETIAREQAQFSSTREEICRSYAGESKHGFCATRLTEARAEALKARADAGEIEKAARHKRRAGG